MSSFRTAAIFLLFIGAFGQAAKSENLNKDPRTLPAGTRPSSRDYDETCRQIRQAAADNGLPERFFARIIWQESRFDPSVRSRAGAEGIAQFMPATAASRGLLDPFEPADALRESASYLRELNRTFGNLGLAAAAYNAGPGRLTRWMSGKSQLPQETLSYVQVVTGRPISEWSAGSAKWNDEGAPSDIPCPSLAMAANPELANRKNRPSISSWSPWGVQLLGDWTKGEVLANYEKLRREHLAVLGDKDPMIVVTYGPSGMSKRFLVRVPENTREEAEEVCEKLHRQSVACFAIRNPTEQEALTKAKLYAHLIAGAQTFRSYPAKKNPWARSSPKRHFRKVRTEAVRQQVSVAREGF